MTLGVLGSRRRRGSVSRVTRELSGASVADYGARCRPRRNCFGPIAGPLLGQPAGIQDLRWSRTPCSISGSGISGSLR